jgi:hypothetical protein
MVNSLEVKVAKVPKAGRGRERHNVLGGLFVVLVVKLLQELDKVLTVLGDTATVIGSGIFLFEENDEQAPMATFDPINVPSQSRHHQMHVAEGKTSGS